MKKISLLLSLLCLICIEGMAQSFVPSPNKAYKIKTAGRGYWVSEYNSIHGTYDWTDEEAEASLYAFIEADSMWYIYSVAEESFVCQDDRYASASLENEIIGNISNVTFRETGNSDYPVCIVDQNDLYYNLNDLRNLVINDWKTLDDGNQLSIVEAADFDIDAQNLAKEILTDVGDEIFYFGIIYKIANGKAIVSESSAQIRSVTHIDIPASFTYEGDTYRVVRIGHRALNSLDRLTSVVIPNSVTQIGESAFIGCSSLSSVVIPDSVTTIGSNAFSGCSSLTSVVIPESVTAIGSNAFNGCSNLKEVVFNARNIDWIGDEVFPSTLVKATIGEDVQSIPTELFRDYSRLEEVAFNARNCVEAGRDWISPSSLVKVTIGEDVQTIPQDVFRGCSGLTSVVIPKSVTSIGKYAFYDCSRLEEVVLNARNCVEAGEDWISPSTFVKVTIGEDVQTIPKNFFRGRSGLTNVVIPESVTTIGEYAFDGCSGLTSIDIPKFVTTIGSNAFANCRGLRTVTIPESVTTIGSAAFTDCSNLGEVVYNAQNCVKVGNTAFPSTLVRLTIGSDVRFLPGDAFSSCSELKEVNVSSIENWMKIEFGNENANPTYYAKQLLVNGNVTRRLTIPEGIKRINAYTFINCESLVTVNLPTSLENVGQNAFKGCTGLQRFYFDELKDFLCLNYDNLESRLPTGNNGKIYVNNELFDLATIGKLVLPQSMKRIPNYAFYGYSFSDVIIPETIETIGQEAFGDVVNVKFLGSPSRIDSSAFGSVKNISIVSPSAWAQVEFDGAFCNWSNTGSLQVDSCEIKNLVVELNDGEKVNPYSFYGAPIDKVRISAETIDDEAFRNSSVSAICLKTNAIGNYAFDGCDSLVAVYSMTPEPPTAQDSAFSQYDGVILYVPKGARNAYENASTCWWRFLDIVETDFADVDEIFKGDDENISTGIKKTGKEGATNIDLSKPMQVFTLNGTYAGDKVGGLVPGFYILRQGSKSAKYVVR